MSYLGRKQCQCVVSSVRVNLHASKVTSLLIVWLEVLHLVLNVIFNILFLFFPFCIRSLFPSVYSLMFFIY